MEHLLPTGGAVTSTHGPEVADKLAPAVTVHCKAFVVPPVTVAKMRRTLPGRTLNP
jgi:hypothetical protein